ncbi:putative Sin3 binding protein-domain-containing protein [Peziza echinospora]|nr:putative Sin3 binding protein-domain-containing protein [Peziza echinospora]
MAAVATGAFASYGPDSFAAGKTASVSIPNSHLRQGPGRELTPPASLQPSGGMTHQTNPSNHVHGIPTPSTSRSPTLPPVYHLNHNSGAKPTSGDRLGAVTTQAEDGSSHHGGTSPQRYYPTSASIAAQAAGSAITPSLLAKYYLPDILLERGPLAIRYLTGHLISSIPGFSNIPPAKQRRLVVGALEGRGGSSGTGESSGALAAGGINGDVIFEKVGWGRWDARRKGDPPREVARVNNQSVPGISVLPPGSESTAMSPDVRNWVGESGVFMQSEDERSRRSISPLSSPAEEADKMSLDEDASVSGSESAGEDVDMTDEEDWAKMGAEMLRRQASPVTSDAFSNAGGRASAIGSPNVQIIYGSWGAGGSSFQTPGNFKHAESYRYAANTNHGFGYWDNGEKRNKEEQEAIEALVQLSSK